MDVNLPKLANKLAPYLAALLKGTATTVPAFPNAIDLPEISTPATPASGYGRIYFKNDGRSYSLSDGGIESPLGGALFTRVYSNVALTLATATLTALPFNAERQDDEELHSTSSNTSRITFARAGRYLIGAHAWYAPNATGIRALFLRLNGSTRIAEEQRPASGTAGPRINVVTMYEVSATNYVEAIGYQNSGGNLNIDTFGNASAELWTWGPL